MQEKLHMTQHPGTDPPPFTTTITDVNEDSVFLEETFCYPRGGGQQGDTGTISNSRIQAKLLETLPGESIFHPLSLVDGFKVGDEVKCIIDQKRRNKNTTMHTVQHIVSALANDLFDAETVGNQISENYTRIDLLFPDRDKFQSSDLEQSVNDVINSQKDVKIHNWDREAILSHDQMRHTKFMDRIPSSITKLRVVEIVDIDLCPCGGTHVDNTSKLNEMTITNVKSKGSGKLRLSYELSNR
ncbi:MAG: alanyl-tRNA editing protein [Candidatus Poseidoniales archaeon]|jgi:misacylated tRNA(Ala) deacylase|nr:alanyl-tRNA editing protein [Candidatus Poseidoniales archaeon]|tara:strand:- start:5784 stop:6509 length:726 start_codon:yes stop_codon:yes gene_type:complete